MCPRQKRKRRRKLSPEEKEEKKFHRSLPAIFIGCGFRRIRTANKEVTIAGRQGELDAVFVYENIVVLLEETAARKQAEILDHVRKKKDFVEHILRNKTKLVDTLASGFPEFAEAIGDYQVRDLRFVPVYASLNPIDADKQERFADIFVFFLGRQVLYFSAIAKAIHRTCRFELFRFLGLARDTIGDQASGKLRMAYKIIFLPESPSGYPEGHKLVSFLADPESLLERAYVLRSNGWETGARPYQRLLIPKKIRDMRKYLTRTGRVFVNNIIVTLPSKLSAFDGAQQPVDIHNWNRLDQQLEIELPHDFGTVGIVDGQHRLLCYHEGNDAAERAIGKLRRKQHLLVTGIIYPQTQSPESRSEFESRLFLEINDKQNRVRSDLRQEIQMLVDPWSPIALAKAVVMELAERGPLCGELEQSVFDAGRIKTASIVSYGLRHIVQQNAEHSLWKLRLKDHPVPEDTEKLKEYVTFCAKKINDLLIAFKIHLQARGLWTRDQKVSRALTTTTINGLIYCLRLLLSRDALPSLETYKQVIPRLKVNFSAKQFKFKSSNWKSLGEKMFSECFG